MTFAEVIPYLKAGEQIIRKSDPWPLIARRDDGKVFMIHTAACVPWIPTIEDLTATDWEIHVPQPGERIGANSIRVEQSPLKRAANKCRELADRIAKDRKS